MEKNNITIESYQETKEKENRMDLVDCKSIYTVLTFQSKEHSPRCIPICPYLSVFGGCQCKIGSS
jgi:hypothetical protein